MLLFMPWHFTIDTEEGAKVGVCTDQFGSGLASSRQSTRPFQVEENITGTQTEDLSKPQFFRSVSLVGFTYISTKYMQRTKNLGKGSSMEFNRDHVTNTITFPDTMIRKPSASQLVEWQCSFWLEYVRVRWRKYLNNSLVGHENKSLSRYFLTPLSFLDLVFSS